MFPNRQKYADCSSCTAATKKLFLRDYYYNVLSLLFPEPIESVVVMAENVGVRCSILNNLVRNNGDVGCGNERLMLFDLDELLKSADEEHQNSGRQDLAKLRRKKIGSKGGRAAGRNGQE